MPRNIRNRPVKKTYTLSVREDIHSRIVRIAKNVGCTQQEITDYLMTASLSILEETMTEKLLELRRKEQIMRQEFMRERSADVRNKLSEMIIIPLN